jgi:transcription elongation GreA/GreB family factor
MNVSKWKKEDKINFKKRLKELCISIIKEKIDEAAVSMERAREAAGGEEKNTMGDKYETSREMANIDRDRAALQMIEGKKQLAQLMQINAEAIYTNVQLGSVVIYREGVYFIATGLGGKEIEGEKIQIVSPAAPITIQLMNKGKGDVVVFNGRDIRIVEVF